MTENKPINTCEFFDICVTDCGGRLEDTEICSCYELYKQLARKTQECEQAEQKLEQIREVAKQMVSECIYDDFKCKDCNLKEGCTYFNKGKILQIIEEVQ